MKFNKLWLKEIIDIDIDTVKLAEQLTMAGLEVDSIEPVAPNFYGVVVGEVLEVTPHPNADKLTVCKVNIGATENLDIVCGALNVREKIKVPVAVVGAELPNDFKIKKAKLRGVDSFGMLCSAVELGLAENSDGLLELPSDALVGVDIRKYLKLDDELVEIELTANRGDCLSILGIAREVAAINHIHLAPIKSQSFQVNNSDVFPITITADDGCPHYCGRIIRGVNNNLDTPIWIKEKLRRLGESSISFVVDITNYVMLELGQPLHAFDLSKLDGGIDVRYARKGEKLELLDGTNIELDDASLVIADKNKPVALAGVMGGNNSGMDKETQDIFLESAFFVPKKVTIQSRRFNIHTDSSYRYERGVDYNLQLKALEYATALIIEIAGGEAGAVSEIVSKEHFPESIEILLLRDSIKKILGISIEDKDTNDILLSLGLKPETVADGWMVKVPSWRFDLKIEEDLVEEVARIYGYHRIPEQKIVAELGVDGSAIARIDRRRLYALMEDLGYNEAITYSFIDEKTQALFGNGDLPLPLVNPISSELSVMRTTLWPGLIKVLQYNLKRQKQRARLFEIGLRFLQKDGVVEQNSVIAGVLCGDLYPQQWGMRQKEPADFFDLKNDVEAILKLYSYDNVEFVPKSHQALHPKRSAQIKVQGKPIGFIGELHPLLRQQLNLNEKTSLFEIDLSFLINELKRYAGAPSRFPKVQRDIAIAISKEIPWSQIKQKIVDISGELLQNVYLFDVYCNENIGLDKHSMAIRLVFQSSHRTLVDTEVESLVGQIISVLQKTFNASLRG
ncbi:MAG: phenylalanine--tRNA ligase subunit beta [Gammaproteobacteria bacterium]|nr:phenylalanine--tRNA ligase subunit beta [Gammaproteobacteria bacterium]